MKRARFRDPTGCSRIGEWTDAGIESAGDTYAFDEVNVLPPVAPTKVLGVHSNYRSFFDSETEYPERPRLFWKGGPHVASGHGDTVAIPDTGDVRAEPELVVVIGEQCRNVDPVDAMDAIAGFTCGNDISDRSQENELRQKSVDGAAPVGPVVVPPEDVPATPSIGLSVDGETIGEMTDEFVFSPAEIVAAFASRVTLEPDDVIMMGSPGLSEVVGDGDTVAIEVEGVGRLEHDIEIRS